MSFTIAADGNGNVSLRATQTACNKNSLRECINLVHTYTTGKTSLRSLIGTWGTANPNIGTWRLYFRYSIMPAGDGHDWDSGYNLYYDGASDFTQWKTDRQNDAINEINGYWNQSGEYFAGYANGPNWAKQ